MMLQRIADVSVFILDGDLDTFESRLLLRHIEELLRYGWAKIILDFSEVEHVHYRFWNGLLGAARATYQRQGALKLANLSSYHHQLLRFAGVDRFFDLYGTIGEAVFSFQHELPSPAGTC